MKEVLASLASRRLEGVRREAKIHSKALRDTIQLIHQTARDAAHALPWEYAKIESEDVQQGKIELGDYLSVLGVVNKVKASSAELLSLAKERMCQEKERRLLKVNRIRHTIAELEKEKTQREAAANANLTVSESQAHQRSYREKPPKPELSIDATIGCSAGCVMFFLGPLACAPLVAVALTEPGPGRKDAENWLTLLFLFFCLLAVLYPLIRQFHWNYRCGFMDEVSKAEEERLVRAAQARHSQELARIETTFSGSIQASQIELNEAEALLKKAQDAYGLILCHEKKIQIRARLLALLLLRAGRKCVSISHECS